jgi:ABC-2 type transport system permease protein
MRRLWFIIGKELSDIRGSLPFHVVVVLSPLIFLVLWTLALAQDITLPVVVEHGQRDASFAEYLQRYTSPDGIPYFRTKATGKQTVDSIRIAEAIGPTNGTIGGFVVHEVATVNRNMTKNYRNRITGAVTSYVEHRYLGSRAIDVIERPTHPHDPPWKHYFVAGILVLGVLMGGSLYGALGMSAEWSTGTIVFLITSPRNPWWILAGKELAVVLKGLAGTGVFLLVALIVVPDLSPNLLGLAATAVPAYWTIGSAGMVVGMAVRDPILCFLVSLLGSLALWLLGNGFADMAIIGSVGAVVADVNPSSSIVAAVQHFVNGTPVQWGTAAIRVAAWLVVLQTLVLVLYRRTIHLAGKRVR